MTNNSKEIYSEEDSLNLTDKQKQAYDLCLKLTSDSDRKKRFLTDQLVSKGVYSTRHQAKKAIKHLLRVESAKLRSKGSEVENTEAETQEGE
jgi:hypothetical protein